MRYAPSPTGYQHVGGIRTAILNYFIAHSLGGEFILRVEDTDHNRFVPGTEQYIIDTLKWLGIHYTEGPDAGGAYGPYRQSERKDIYREYAMQLVENGKAYYAFDKVEVLDTAREEAESAGKALVYNYLSRDKFDNSLTLSTDEVEKRLQRNDPFVIRVKLPADTYITFTDLIRGEIKVNTKELEDRVILKSDGWPTYHLAHIVDDKLMHISHVIRGEEWLPSAPVHYYLYEALGWEEYRPAFAHLPLVLNPTGNGKLSKRKFKDATTPIFPLSWVGDDGVVVKGMREEGFLPEAVINILLLFGWHKKDGQEIFSRASVLQEIKIQDIQKAGARYDYEKAKWINRQFIESASMQYLVNLYLSQTVLTDLDIDRLRLTISYLKGKISLLKEIEDYAFLFSEHFQSGEVSSLDEVCQLLSEVVDWDRLAIKDALGKLPKEKMKVYYPAIRQSLSGSSVGMDVVEMLFILGKVISLSRLSNV